MKQTFELFYSSGGHGGPYQSISAAVRTAKRILRGVSSPSLQWIDIVVRDPLSVGGFGRSVKRVARTEVRGD